VGASMNSLASTVILVVGLALLAGSAVLFFRQWAWLARARPAEGEVVELLRSRRTGEYVVSKTDGRRQVSPKYLYRPVVRFKTGSGRSVTFQASVAMRDNRARNPARPRPYSPGDRVQVLYDPDHPQKAQIAGTMYLWFYPLLLLFFSLFAVFMGLLGLILART
jgi:hypothetical protein